MFAIYVLNDIFQTYLFIIYVNVLLFLQRLFFKLSYISKIPNLYFLLNCCIYSTAHDKFIITLKGASNLDQNLSTAMF